MKAPTASVLALAATLLLPPGALSAQTIDILVTEYVDEAGNTKKALEDSRVVQALVQSVDWSRMAAQVGLPSHRNLTLTIEGRRVPLPDGPADPDRARDLIQSSQWRDEYGYSLDPNRRRSEGLQRRQRVEQILRAAFDGLGLRNELVGNPVNALEIAIRDASQRPDLALADASVRAGSAGETLVLSWAVHNVGRSRTPASVVVVKDVETGDIVEEQELQPIPPQERHRESTATVPIPAAWRGSERRLAFHVDPQDRIPELREDNNVHETAALLVRAVPPKPRTRWPAVWTALGLVAVAVAVVTAVARRRGPARPAEEPVGSAELRARAHADPGRQRVVSEAASPASSGIALRVLPDPGTQSIAIRTRSQAPEGRP